MATIRASSLGSTIARTAAAAVSKTAVSSPVLRKDRLSLPRVEARGGRVRCSSSSEKAAASRGVGASSVAAASVMSASTSPVLALVDERMSTEGTGLSLGLSDNLLGWILLGVFGVIWSLYFVYTSSLDEDEDSGLSL